MRKKRRRVQNLSISAKTNRILNGILVVLLLITVRLWHLSIFQHEEKLEDSQKPQRRIVVERSERATIRDRFDVILAKNQAQYNATISYGEIREVPRVKWVRDEKGKRKKIFKRKNYIKELSSFLGELLDLDPERIEDQIHAKASVFGSVPFLLKEGISESQYFRLKMLEKDWPGVHGELVARRSYPQGPIGADVVGYLGSISLGEYEAVTREMRQLRDLVERFEEREEADSEQTISIEEVKERLKELEKKAYSINDLVGKAGVEGSYDAELRGTRGKKIYLSDIRGHLLKELPGSEESKPGSRLYLTISTELQAYAERLLAEYEQSVSCPRIIQLRNDGLIAPMQPWIKGGAIIAMDPRSGEILALASYPRFDPNDFIRHGANQDLSSKKNRIHKWLENERYLGAIWDLKEPLEREKFDPVTGCYQEEKLWLTWENYLNFVLPNHSRVRKVLENRGTVRDAIAVQAYVEELLKIFREDDKALSPSKIFDALFKGEEDVPTGVIYSLGEKEWIARKYNESIVSANRWMERLNDYFQELPLNEEKLLLCDFYRLIIDLSKVSPAFIERFGHESLSHFRSASQHFVWMREVVQDQIKDLFHKTLFKKWREASFKEYLAQKREEEVAQKRKFGRPYLEYLDEVEKKLFEEFWLKHQWDFYQALFNPSFKIPDEKAFCEMWPHFCAWKSQLCKEHEKEWQQHIMFFAKHLSLESPPLIPLYLQALKTFNDLHRPLYGIYKSLRSQKGELAEQHLASAFYPPYGYGYVRSQAFRQPTTIGSIFKLVPAYEALRQRVLASEEKSVAMKDLNPLVIIDDKKRVGGKTGWIVGYTQEGKPIPLFYKGGRLTRTDHYGVGKVDLVGALETSSNSYFSLLAGEVLEDAEDMAHAARNLGFGEKTGVDLPGEVIGKVPEDISYNRSGLYAMAIGQHSMLGTPLQTAVMLSAFANGGNLLKPHIVHASYEDQKTTLTETEVRKTIYLSSSMRNLLLTGLQQVVLGSRGTARFLKHQYSQDFLHRFIGKSSTAEVVERLSLQGGSAGVICKHIWFGAISFESAKDFSKPDLVVVVYLRFGEYGKEGAPLAAKMVAKWQEILLKHQK